MGSSDLGNIGDFFSAVSDLFSGIGGLSTLSADMSK